MAHHYRCGCWQVGRALKKPLKYSESVVFSSGRKSLTGAKKTAGMIGDRERIAILTISQQELALVISAPQFVGALPQRTESSRARAGAHDRDARQSRGDRAARG